MAMTKRLTGWGEYREDYSPRRKRAKTDVIGQSTDSGLRSPGFKS